jgi:hypothetical protein
MKEMHHAYLLVGNPEETQSLFGSLLIELGISTENNPDFFPFYTETFGVDDARKLRELSGRRSFAGKKIFYVSPERFTLEAQNALLKTLEEPTVDTHIFLSVRERDSLVPTLLSRLQVILVDTKGPTLGTDSQGRTLVNSFLGMSLNERLDYAKKFGDSGASLPAFLDGLLISLRQKGGDSTKQLGEIAKFRSFSDIPSASARLILEHLSFVV